MFFRNTTDGLQPGCEGACSSFSRNLPFLSPLSLFPLSSYLPASWFPLPIPLPRPPHPSFHPLCPLLFIHSCAYCTSPIPPNLSLLQAQSGAPSSLTASTTIIKTFNLAPLRFAPCRRAGEHFLRVLIVFFEQTKPRIVPCHSFFGNFGIVTRS